MWISNMHLLRNVVVKDRIAILLGKVHLVGLYRSISFPAPTSDQIDRLRNQRNGLVLILLLIHLLQLREEARLRIHRQLRLLEGVWLRFRLIYWRDL